MFIRRFGVMWPRSIKGAVLFVGLLAFMANTFVAIDRDSHSVSDTLYGIFPFWGCAFLLYQWLAGALDGGANDKA